MIWRVVGVRGRVMYSTGFAWSPGFFAHVVSDIRESAQVVNGREAANYAVPGLRQVLVDGFMAYQEDPPEWWDRSEAEARRRVGLPPRPEGAPDD